MNIKDCHRLHSGKKTLEKCVAQANHACDEAVVSLFKVVYFLGSICEFIRLRIDIAYRVPVRYLPVHKYFPVQGPRYSQCDSYLLYHMPK